MTDASDTRTSPGTVQEQCAKIAEMNHALMFTKAEHKEVARKVAAVIARGIRNAEIIPAHAQTEKVQSNAVEQCIEAAAKAIVGYCQTSHTFDRKQGYVSERIWRCVALVSPAASSWQPDITAGMKAAMEIVGNMRQSESGLFDAMHSGQRGEDRSNALYDAYCAIRRALLVPSTEEK